MFRPVRKFRIKPTTCSPFPRFGGGGWGEGVRPVRNVVMALDVQPSRNKFGWFVERQPPNRIGGLLGARFQQAPSGSSNPRGREWPWLPDAAFVDRLIVRNLQQLQRSRPRHWPPQANLGSSLPGPIGKTSRARKGIRIIRRRRRRRSAHLSDSRGTGHLGSDSALGSSHVRLLCLEVP